jgi:alkylhydroperoxidase family enzyme
MSAMPAFPVHTIESAPERSRAVLQSLQQAFGVVPNLAGVIAGSPVLAEGFLGVFRAVHGGSFSEAEIQVLLLTDAVTNRSAWPVAFHSALALQEGVAPADVEAMRAGREPGDRRLGALSALASGLIEARGHLEPRTLAAFLEAGYSREQALEAILVVAASTITNYAASLGRPPLEAAFEAQAWAA